MTEHAIRNGGTSWNSLGDGALETPERLGEWTLIAALSQDGQQTIVLENPAGTDGSIVYLTEGGVLPPRSKTREPTAEQRAQLYRAPIREEELANGHEPTCDEVSKVSPPIRRARKVGLKDRNGPHTFIGTPQTVDSYPICCGKEYGARLDPFALTSGITSAVVGGHFSRGVVGERLPTVRTFYSVVDLIGWNSVVFAGVHATNLFQQPSFHGYLRLENGQVNESLCLDSYLPYRFDSTRVWTELMGSGLIPRPALGAIGNHKYIVVVLAHSQGRRFLQRDMVEAFLLLCFALISHAYTRDTWSASECVDLNRDRQEHTPRTAAAELVVAPLAKGTLVFENPNDESYGLAKATPREWLTHSGRISATRVPTRYGVVGFRIDSRIDNGRLTAKATVKPHDEISPSSMYLRLRTPGRRAIASVGIKGSAWPVSDSGSERITLSGGGRGSTLQIQHT